MSNYQLSNTELDLLQKSIRIIFNYPEEGIAFFDITTTLKDPKTFHILINGLTQQYIDQNIDVVVGVEARGFILAAALAYNINAGFVPIRKKGKLPADTISRGYQSEYDQSMIEIHCDAIQKKQRVLLVDDLIATGQTILSSIEMIEELGGELVEVASFVEFLDMPGGQLIRDTGHSLFSLCQSYGSIEHYQS
ncbi:adenine phosphoribosyltransferase [Neisseriaceae bacterium PsAf]|nr:adenine phosphoribosyltransferase [Neisseriaceae bacterium PsAf]MCV2503010.1 adenine phosphoribosyltransferase [Neisseriaceae bacterium]